MKIIEILKEQGPEGGPQTPIGTKKPTGSVTAPVKRKTPKGSFDPRINPFGANKQLQKQADSMVKQANTAYQGRQEGGKYTPDAGPEENWNSAAGKTIKTGTIDPNLEQSGKDYAQDLQRKLNKTQQSTPQVNQVQNRANK